MPFNSSAFYCMCPVSPLKRSHYIGPLVGFHIFLHDRPWISPWIKSISKELEITCHVFASQLSGHCDVIASRLWRHQQNVQRSSETRMILILASFIDSLCRVRNEIMYLLSWRTISALTRVLFCCLFPSLLRNEGRCEKKCKSHPKFTCCLINGMCTYLSYGKDHWEDRCLSYVGMLQGGTTNHKIDGPVTATWATGCPDIVANRMFVY